MTDTFHITIIYNNLIGPVLLLSTYAEREELFSNTISKIENCKPGEMGTEASVSTLKIIYYKVLI